MHMAIKTFEELSLSELYDILRLRCDVFIVEQACPYPDTDGRDTLCHHLIISEDNALIAYLRILPAGVSFNEVSIGRVAVHPDHRGGGLAKRMMEAAMAHAQTSLGAKAIKISAQAYLTGFYGSLGFGAVSEPYLEDGIPHVDMLWQQK